MKTAMFLNFSEEEFIGYWNGKGRKYPAGASEYMPDYLARHFAKHLVNRELLRKNADGTPVYKDGEKMTSPKKPEDQPLFMELFNKAFISDDVEDAGETQDSLDALIGAANKNRKKQTGQIESVGPVATPRQPKPQEDENYSKKDGGSTGPQVITPPGFDQTDEEGEFQGKPVET